MKWGPKGKTLLLNLPVILTVLAGLVLSAAYYRVVPRTDLLAVRVAISLLLGLYLFIVIRREGKIEKIVDQRTSELKELNEKLKEEIAKRERLEKLKDEFVGTVSHEIRTPLTLVNSAVANLRDGIEGPLNPGQQKLADGMKKNIARLKGIIDELLDLSRLESDKVTLKRKEVPLTAVVRDLVANFSGELSARGLKVEMDMPSAALAVHADEDLLVQLLSNLMTNAVHFAKNRIVIGSVGDASSEEGTSWAHIRVMDDGPGIPKEKQGLLFQKFVQLRRPSGGAGYKGTGLGLAICKQIVTLHGGKIWLDSVEGEGAAFHVVLPLFVPGIEFTASLKKALLRAGAVKAPLALVALKLGPPETSPAKMSRLNGMSVRIEALLRDEILRKSDAVTRSLVPDCILMMIDGTSRKEVLGISRRILEKIRSYAEGEGDSGRGLTPRMGIALYPEEGVDSKTLIAKAVRKVEGGGGRKSDKKENSHS